jgi:hypothetical protein
MTRRVPSCRQRTMGGDTGTGCCPVCAVSDSWGCPRRWCQELLGTRGVGGIGCRGAGGPVRSCPQGRQLLEELSVHPLRNARPWSGAGAQSRRACATTGLLSSTMRPGLVPGGRHDPRSLAFGIGPTKRRGVLVCFGDRCVDEGPAPAGTGARTAPRSGDGPTARGKSSSRGARGCPRKPSRAPAA